MLMTGQNQSGIYTWTVMLVLLLRNNSVVNSDEMKLRMESDSLYNFFKYMPLFETES